MHNRPMNERISCLPVLRLKPGMTLARALLRPDGAVLMPEGTELSESQLGQLQQRGIEVVYIRQADPRSAEEIEQETAESRARLDYIFRSQAGGDSEQPGMGDARVDLHAALVAYRCQGAQP